MKAILKFVTITIISTLLFSCKGKNSENANLENLRDSASYAIGISVGANLADNNLDSLNMEAFLAGFNDAKDPESFKIPMQELNLVLESFIVSELKNQNKDVIKAGEEFLAQNAKKAGIKTTPSGLQYEIIKQGTGANAKTYDSVTVHYHGTKLDGSVFDSSIGSNPITFSLAPGQLIQGWIEGLSLINKGSKIKLYVPYELAYGMSGFNAIKPFETLIFEIELIDVKEGKAPEFDPAMYQQMQQPQ